MGVQVILAEDDPEFRGTLAAALRSWGLEVREARNGTELTELVFGAGDRPDLVVTDVRMPGPSGLSVLRCIRVESAATPIILMTAFPDDDLRQEASELGAALLEKPFRLTALRRLVGQALGQ